KRENRREVFRHVRAVLAAPTPLFANLERAYTDAPHRVPGELGGIYGPAHVLDVYADVGFDVLSLANNHILDVGYDAMLENRAQLRALGIATAGAGESLADAREPAIVEADGLRVAVLAYASIFPYGYDARSDPAGL